MLMGENVLGLCLEHDESKGGGGRRSEVTGGAECSGSWQDFFFLHSLSRGMGGEERERGHQKS